MSLFLRLHLVHPITSVEELLFDRGTICQNNCNSRVALRHSTCTLLKLIVEANICPRTRCKLLNPGFWKDRHRTVHSFTNCLNSSQPFFGNGNTTVQGLCTSPAALYSFEERCIVTPIRVSKYWRAAVYSSSKLEYSEGRYRSKHFMSMFTVIGSFLPSNVYLSNNASEISPLSSHATCWSPLACHSHPMMICSFCSERRSITCIPLANLDVPSCWCNSSIAETEIQHRSEPRSTAFLIIQLFLTPCDFVVSLQFSLSWFRGMVPWSDVLSFVNKWLNSTNIQQTW